MRRQMHDAGGDENIYIEVFLSGLRTKLNEIESVSM